MSAELRKRWAQAGGTFPENWKIVPLETLLRDSKGIAVGVMYPGPNTLGGVPLIKVGDVDGGLVSLTPCYCISAEVNAEYKRTQLAGDELLITLVGNPGECVVVKQHMAGWNAARAIAVIRLEDPSLRVYLKTVLESTACRHLIDAVLNTTVQKTLNLKDIRLLPIPMPPKQVIQAISGFSNALNDRITLLRETNATLESITQALFKSWFVDFDPVRAKAEELEPAGMDADTAALFPDSFEESKLGLVPKGWVVSTLDDISDVGIGKTPPRKEAHWFTENTDDVRWVSIRDMGSSGAFLTETSECLTASAVSRFNVRKVPDNTVLLSFKMTIGRVAITSGEMTTNEAIAHCKLTEQSPLSSEYIYLHLRQFDYSTLSSTSSIADAVNSKTVKAISILVPDADVAAAFQRTVSVIFDRIKTVQQQTKTLTQLRDTLLPRLISGQLRLPETEASIENILSEAV
jgi:type I restriction enzyme S subunit